MKRVRTRGSFKVWQGVRWLLPFVVGAALLFSTYVTATAHPLGNFSVNRYSRLELSTSEVTIFYILDMAEIPTFQEQSRMDTDGDRAISVTEREQYLGEQLSALQNNLLLEVNGAMLPLELQEHAMEFVPGQGGLETLRLSARFVAPLPGSHAKWVLHYRDTNYP